MREEGGGEGEERGKRELGKGGCERVNRKEYKSAVGERREGEGKGWRERVREKGEGERGRVGKKCAMG